MLLRGECHGKVTPIFFGGSLIALENKSGRIPLIAIGYTLPRIAVKCAKKFALSSLDNKLLPTHLGHPRGCKAAVHATRRFINDMPVDFVIAKLDFSNAFINTLRDTMLNTKVEHVPEIYRFCQLAYDVISALKFFNHTVSSQRVQQGDPLGPLLFYLSIHSFLLACQSQLKIDYMDDITLGGPTTVFAADVALVKAQRYHLAWSSMKRSVRLLQQMATLMKFPSSNLFITVHYLPHCLELFYNKNPL